jgi:hypothetical protein
VFFTLNVLQLPCAVVPNQAYIRQEFFEKRKKKLSAQSLAGLKM